MNDEDNLHDEAEEIRKETANGAPELQEHDRLAEMEKALEEANNKAMPWPTQNAPPARG
jgi:molecular chaperone GrpE